jgi:EAL domain-containing protein (putative c-di-GMP-specific phosphodiesterase class I)
MNAQIVWHHPQRGLLQFQQFAAAVEQNGLQVTFERWLLEQVCLSLSQQPLNQQNNTIMLQISAAHLLHGQLLNRLQQLVSQYRLSPSLLTLCITEQGWLLDPALFAKQCQQLVRAGFLLALQDFGQGHCALKILSAVSWHQVILSGRLIDPIEHSDTARNHLACLIRLINARQLPVTAADVTQELQAYLLHVMGCRDAYGEFWGLPQTAAQWRQVTEIAETA